MKGSFRETTDALRTMKGSLCATTACHHNTKARHSTTTACHFTMKDATSQRRRAIVMQKPNFFVR
jgi:hypothetical protein